MKHALLVKSLFFILLALFSVGAFAQGPTPLKEGEPVPDMALTLYRGDSVQHCRLSDFRGKAVLLDFWGAGCQPCIASLPHMLEVQQKFKDQLVVIFYTDDKLQEYKSLFNTAKANFGSRVVYAAEHLPSVVEDTTLKKLFPSRTWGLKVWVDAKGIYRASKMDEPTAEDIHSFLNGGAIRSDHVALLPDHITADEWLDKRIGYTDHLLSYAILSKYDERYSYPGDISAAFNRFKQDSVSRRVTAFNMMNVSAYQLYRIAWFHNSSAPKSKFVFEGGLDPHDYYDTPGSPDRKTSYDEMIDWREHHLFCYTAKAKKTEDIFAEMRKKLDGYFGLHSSLEKRKVKCLVLKRTGPFDKLKTKFPGIEPDCKTPADDLGNDLYIMHNVSYEGNLPPLIKGLFSDASTPHPLTFIDETHYKGNIDIELYTRRNHQYVSRNDLRQQLHAYGLDLVEEYREQEVLVLRPNKPNGKQAGTTFTNF